MSRLELTDNLMDTIIKMSEGNPGAATAMMSVIEKNDSIDPQSMMGGLGSILLLDTWEIYGTDIYILFSDKCQRDTRKFLMLLRAVQLGFLGHSKLQAMGADEMREIDLTEEEWADLDNKVCERLEDFQRAA